MLKKILSLSLVSVVLSSSFLIPVRVHAEDASAPSDHAQQDVQKIADFLEEFSIIKTCLKNRKGQEKKPLTSAVAVCATLRVFDQQSGTVAKSWKRAQALNLVNQDQKESQTLTGFEFLQFLFKTTGITISPITQASYEKLFKKVHLSMNGEEEKRILSLALDQGLITAPTKPKDSLAIRKKLFSRPLHIAEGLGFLYQVANRKQQEVTVRFEPEATSTGPLESVFQEVVKIIKNQSYFSADFDQKKAMEEALKAIVKTMKEKDKYMEYFTTEEFNNFSSSLSGNLEGIGAYIEMHDEQVIVVSPITGSPAEKAGLQPEDVILKVNAVDVKGMTLEQVVAKIRGPKGSTVTLTIKRANVTLEVAIQRDKITVPAVSASNKNGIEVIKMSQFSSSSSEEMESELKSLLPKNPKGILIDLRNNPGGFLNEVVTIANDFVAKDNPLVILKDREKQTVLKATTDPLVKNIPIAVLINKGSASASEILAGILQSYGLAKIYGETSYGKGTVQNVITLRDPVSGETSGFKLTTSEYLIGRPNGGIPISINGIGVKPVDNPQGADKPILDDKTTPQVDEALETVLGLMNAR